MKRFREYLNEDFDPAIYNSDGGISIEDSTVVDAINSTLEVATAFSYRTPYNSLEEIRKVLAYYKIFLPKSIFLDQTDGNDVFEISQFGEKTGMNDQGEVVTASDSSLFVYFEWSVNEKGMYDTFACICNQEELDDILADFDSEAGDDINEEVMPDLKKKMGAKKVTLPNMMKKEEKKLDEINMSKAAYVNAMQSTTGYDAGDDEGRIDTKKLIARAKKYKGEKFAKDLAGADQMTSRPNRNEVPGQWGSDQLAWREPVRKTKDGKANKQDIKKRKNEMTPGDYRKPKFKKRNLPESEQLDEISHKLAKKAEHKAAKNYYDAYDSEADAREKHIKNKTSETRKGAEDAKAKRTKAAKRVMKFQQYADKKKVNEVLEDPKKKTAYLKAAKADRDLAISDREHYKKNLTDPDRAWTKGIPHKDNQYKMAVDRNKRAMKRKKGIERAEKKNINEVSRATAERAYAAAREKGRDADEISSMLSQAGEKHSPLRDKWQKRANKKWNQARKFADYSDKKNVSEGQLDELKGTSTRGKLIDYALRATHQLHHSDPYKFDRTGQQAKNITKRMNGMQLAAKKLDRINKDQ